MKTKPTKSKAAKKVLHLMDMDVSYKKALHAVITGDRRLNKDKLEKELNRYI